MGEFNSNVKQNESQTASWNRLCSTFEGPLYAYIYTLPKKSVYSSLPSSQGLTGQQGDKKVRPECDKVCSTYKVLHDPSLNQDTQGLHSLCMLN